MTEPKTNTLVILTDLGIVRAFRTHTTYPDNQHLVEIDVPGQPPAREQLHNQVSDQAGRFPRGSETGEPGGMRHGEVHGKTAEEERRQLREIAATVENLVTEERCEAWRLAAPKTINNRLVALLSVGIRKRLVLNLHADFGKLPIREVEERLLLKPTSISTSSDARHP